MLFNTTKFQRTYVLTIQGADGKSITIGNFDGSSPLLSLEFSISVEALASQGNSTFRIKNLDPDTRRNIYKSNNIPNSFVRTIELQAGYVGNPLSIVFSGIQIEAYSYREEGSTDYYTVIEARDLSLVLSGCCHTTRTVATAAGITQNDLIEYLFQDLESKASSLGVSLTKGIVSLNYGAPTLPPSVTLDGWTWDLLQTVTDKTCYIANNRLYCLLNNEAYSSSLSEISSNTGLVAPPKIAYPNIVAEMLFEPTISIGQSINLVTTTQIGLSNLDSRFNGIYKVIGIRHRGMISSSEGGKCRTIVELKQNVNQLNAPLNGNVPSPNSTYGPQS